MDSPGGSQGERDRRHLISPLKQNILELQSKIDQFTYGSLELHTAKDKMTNEIKSLQAEIDRMSTQQNKLTKDYQQLELLSKKLRSYETIYLFFFFFFSFFCFVFSLLFHVPIFSRYLADFFHC